MTTPEQQLAPQINSSRPYTEVQGKSPQFSQFAKRIIDVTGSAVLLSLLSPVLGLVTFLILVFDGSPVIYRRRVVGKNGEFDAFKFRTMRRDADMILEQDPMLRAEFSCNFKLKDDPRVTRVGALLRKFSLDELPQLVQRLSRPDEPRRASDVHRGRTRKIWRVRGPGTFGKAWTNRLLASKRTAERDLRGKG